MKKTVAAQKKFVADQQYFFSALVQSKYSKKLKDL
jgi:hypothetical protein